MDIIENDTDIVAKVCAINVIELSSTSKEELIHTDEMEIIDKVRKKIIDSLNENSSFRVIMFIERNIETVMDIGQLKKMKNLIWRAYKKWGFDDEGIMYARSEMISMISGIDERINKLTNTRPNGLKKPVIIKRSGAKYRLGVAYA